MSRVCETKQPNLDASSTDQQKRYIYENRCPKTFCLFDILAEQHPEEFKISSNHKLRLISIPQHHFTLH
jgi:hypothetical protein